MKYIIIGIIVVSFLFYWYQIRPSQIKAACTNFVRVADEIRILDDAEYDRLFNSCLKVKGF